MRPFSRWIFVVAAFIEVALLCKDARDWCLWLPGLTICAAGLLADRRSHLCGNTLFWIVCLVLYVIAPASQWEGGYFNGPISVVGIHFSDAIIMRTIALADLFMGSALAVQLLMRRGAAISVMGIGSAHLCPFPALAAPRLAVEGATAWAHASPSPSPPQPPVEEPTSGMEDNQAFVLVDDPGEFTYIPALAEEAPALATSSLEDNQAFILVDDPGEFRYIPAWDEAATAEPPPAEGSDHERPLARADGSEGATLPPAAIPSDPISAIVHSRALAVMLLAVSMGVPTVTFLLTGNIDFVTSGREFGLNAFTDSALGTLFNSFTQDLLVVLTLLAIERHASRRTRGNLMLLAIVAACTLIMINPFNTARYQVGAVLIMVVLFSCRGRLPMALAYAGIALYLCAIMPLMNLLRYGFAGMQGQKAAVGIDFNTLDYDCFSMFTFAVYRTAIDDFAYGRFLCSAALFFLPRSLWPDKPRPSSSDLGQYLMQHHSGWFDNLSCPPMGDGYMDFGIVGVVGMGAVFGYLIERSDQVIDRWSQSTFVRRGLAAAVVAFIPILLRGSLGAVMGFVIAPVILLAILWVSARIWRRTTGH